MCPINRTNFISQEILSFLVKMPVYFLRSFAYNNDAGKPARQEIISNVCALICRLPGAGYKSPACCSVSACRERDISLRLANAEPGAISGFGVFLLEEA